MSRPFQEEKRAGGFGLDRSRRRSQARGDGLELESEKLKAEGRTEGEAIGQARGETRLGSLITRLLQDQRTEEIPIVSTDAKRREQLYKEYNL